MLPILWAILHRERVGARCADSRLLLPVPSNPATVIFSHFFLAIGSKFLGVAAISRRYTLAVVADIAECCVRALSSDAFNIALRTIHVKRAVLHYAQICYKLNLHYRNGSVP